MNRAAACGHLDIVESLHANRSEGIPSVATIVYADSSHLDIVKFLCEHCSEESMIPAVMAVATHSHLKVAKWLHENGVSDPKGIDYAYQYAAQSGHLGVVTYLALHCGVSSASIDVHLVLEGKYFHVLEWLPQHEPGYGCGTRVEQPSACTLGLPADSGRLNVRLK